MFTPYKYVCAKKIYADRKNKDIRPDVKLHWDYRPGKLFILPKKLQWFVGMAVKLEQLGNLIQLTFTSWPSVIKIISTKVNLN